MFNIKCQIILIIKIIQKDNRQFNIRKNIREIKQKEKNFHHRSSNKKFKKPISRHHTPPHHTFICVV